MYDSHQSARSATPFLVGQEGIDFTAAQAGFVNTQMGTHVLRIYQIFRSVFQLFPPAEVAEMVLVLGDEEFAVHTVMVGYALYALSRAFNPLLLKSHELGGESGAGFRQAFEIISEYLTCGTVYPFTAADMKINTAPADREVLYRLIVGKTIRTDSALFIVLAGHILTLIKPIFQTVGFF